MQQREHGIIAHVTAVIDIGDTHGDKGGKGEMGGKVDFDAGHGKLVDS